MTTHHASDDLLDKLIRLRELQEQVQVQIEAVMAEFNQRTAEIREQVDRANGKVH